MVWSSGGRSFQIRGAVMDVARLENMRWEVTGGRERVRQDDDRVEHIYCFQNNDCIDASNSFSV